MIEKPKRPKKPDIQDRQPPRTLEELINRYDLDNNDVYNFLDKLVSQYNTDIKEVKTQNILWQDDNGSYMNENQVANLNDRVSNQNTGIVLIFSAYTPGEGSHDYGWHEYFIPKKIVELKPGGGHDILIPDNSMDYGVRACKYLYVFDDHINGNAFNVGVHGNLNNSLDVLRYVIGV